MPLAGVAGRTGGPLLSGVKFALARLACERQRGRSTCCESPARAVPVTPGHWRMRSP